MPEIKIFDSLCQLEQGENLLDGLLRQGIRIPYSCRAGICHSCLLKLENGCPPKGSQDLLSNKQVQNHYILACQSTVSGNLHVELIQRDEMPATIVSIEKISPTCIALILSPRFPIQKAVNGFPPTIALDVSHDIGEQCQIERINGDGREVMVLVERKAGDSFSSWVHEQATKGDQVMLRLL